MRSVRPLPGAAFLILSALLFSIMGVFVREASQSVNNENVVFFRNLVGVVFFLPLLFAKGFAPFRTTRVRSHVIRTGYGLAAMYCFFYAIAHLPLADAMIFTYAAPVFTPVLAWLWLREPLTRKMMLLSLVGMLGVILVGKPSGALFSKLSLVGIAASLLAASAFVSIREMSSSEPAYRIVFYYALFSMLFSAVPLTWAWQPLDSRQLMLLLGGGLVASMAQFSMSKAYSLAPLGVIGPVAYSAIVFSGIIGWWLWNEVPDTSSLVGALLIFGASLLSVLGKPPAPVPAASPASD